MTNREMEERLRLAFDKAAPDVLSSVLADCEEQRGKVISMTERKRTNRWAKRLMGAAAAVVLLLGGAVGVGAYRSNYGVASTVSLDVNPSIEIEVNKNERVLRVVPLNEDGKTVVGDMDFKGSDLEMTVNALVGSMLRGGYISEAANSILVSIDNSDPDQSAALREKLAQEISGLLETDTFSGAVLSQSVSKNKELKKLADEYGITLGKAQLILQITEQDSRYTFEELVPLTINELNLISESGRLHLNQVKFVGTASDKKYIGEEEAKKAALKHAGLDGEEVSFYQCRLDCEDGVMVYEIEFYADGYEYEYDVEALTGTVRKAEREDEEERQLPNGNANGVVSGQSASLYIGKTAARKAALEHAGLKVSDVEFTKCELEEDDGTFRYEIEFYTDRYEYEYEINAKTGKIEKAEREENDDYVSLSSSEKQIGADKAKKAALKHAGVKAADAAFEKCELDEDDGRAVYEIEFQAGGFEYAYRIDAVTGDVLGAEREESDDLDEEFSTSHKGYIGEEKAKKAALKHAGVKDADAAFEKCELDEDDGRAVYEIEFQAGDFEYEYQIDAVTGEVLDAEADD